MLFRINTFLIYPFSLSFIPICLAANSSLHSIYFSTLSIIIWKQTSYFLLAGFTHCSTIPLNPSTTFNRCTNSLSLSFSTLSLIIPSNYSIFSLHSWIFSDNRCICYLPFWLSLMTLDLSIFNSLILTEISSMLCASYFLMFSEMLWLFSALFNFYWYYWMMFLLDWIKPSINRYSCLRFDRSLFID